MVRVGFEHLLVILVVAVLGVSCAVQENSQEFPSLLTALGTKMALADDYYDDDDSGKDAAQTPANGCCYPLVWEGFSVHTLSSAPVGGGGRGHRKSGPKVSKSVDQFYVDGSHQRLAGHKRAYFGHHHAVNISWIFSIGANRTGDYYLFDKAAQKCAHRVVRNVAWHRQCLPSNATYHGAFSLGPVGGLNVQLWSFGGRSRSSPAIDGDRHPPPRPRVYFGASMLVVPTTCIPVLVQEHGFVFRGVDQQQEDEFSSRMNIDDTGSLSGEDLHYESYARYGRCFPIYGFDV